MAVPFRRAVGVLAQAPAPAVPSSLEPLTPAGSVPDDGAGREMGEEVDTDLEEQDAQAAQEAPEAAEEVEEQLDSEATPRSDPTPKPPRPSSRTSSLGRPRSSSLAPTPSSRATGPEDYSPPEANKEVWRKFGCNTGAGRALRKLYGTPGEAIKKVNYPRLPSPSSRWEFKKAPRAPCAREIGAKVKVPHAGGYPRPDPDDPRNWRMPIPCRKPEAQIRAEMEADVPERPLLPRGRNNKKEKEDLADRFRYCGGRMMPKGAMGNVARSESLPPPRRANKPRSQVVDPETGMNGEEREIFEELSAAVARKQKRLAEIDAADAADKDAGARVNKETTSRNKEGLQLENDIKELMRDINKLLDITG